MQDPAANGRKTAMNSPETNVYGGKAVMHGPENIAVMPGPQNIAVMPGPKNTRRDNRVMLGPENNRRDVMTPETTSNREFITLPAGRMRHATRV